MTEERRGPVDVSEENLDLLLDAALRRMAGGEGSVDMRHRVLARLTEPPRAVVPRGAMLAAAATIALAAATGALLRRPVVHSPAATSAHRDVPPAASPLSPPPAPPGSPMPVRWARLAGRPAPRPVGGRQAPERLTPAAAAAEVAEMEPIALSPLAVAPMSSDHVTVGALRIERLRIEPLAEAQP